MLWIIEDMYGLGYVGASADATPITDVFAAAVPEPSSYVIMGFGFAGVSLFRRRFARKSA